MYNAGKDGSKVTTVVATAGAGSDRPQEVSYTDTKVIGNGSFGVVYQAKLCDTGEMVAIKKVLQDKRFKVFFNPILHEYFPFFYLLTLIQGIINIKIQLKKSNTIKFLFLH